MKRNIVTTAVLLFTLYLTSLCAQVKVNPDHKTGIYKAGQTVTWNIEIEDLSAIDSLHYMVRPGDFTTSEQGQLKVTDNKAQITYKFTQPGSVLLKVGWKNKDNNIEYTMGGAIADPDEIKLSSSKPSDFDVFWKEKVQELKAIPENVVLKQEDCEVEGVDYYKISMDNIHGTHIRGQLAKPSKGEKLPALLIVQWAGVYPLEREWVTNYAEEGWLVLNINPHDLPIDNEKDFYDNQFQNELKNYWAIGNDDRDSSYYLRMYLSCYRAADYLAHRDDWNGKTLVVTGTSQGGMQSVMTAGLYPGITACAALVPAGFDLFGPEAERKGGWPQWYDWVWDKDADKVRETSRYYDVANFVPHIKCPVFIGVGLVDEVCPPAGIVAGLNQLRKHKELMILVNSGHQDQNGTQAPYSDRLNKVWLPALKDGIKPKKN